MLLFALSGGWGGVFADDGKAAKPAAKKEAPPEIRELWVPAEHLDSVLKKFPRAVMLTPDQYERLLRDSLPDEEEKNADVAEIRPPVASVLGQVELTGVIHDDVVEIMATYDVEILVEDQWTEIPLMLPREQLAKISVNGEGVGAVRKIGEEKNALQLLVRGDGHHQVVAEFHLPIERNASGKTIRLPSPRSAAAKLGLAVSSGIELDSELPFSVADGIAQFVLPASGGDEYEIRWAAGNIAPIDDAAIFQTCRYLYSIDTARVQGDLGLVLSSNLRDLPTTFLIDLPKEVRLLSIEGSELLRWVREDDTGTVRVDLVAGTRRAADLRLLVEAPVDLDEDGDSAAATIALPSVTVQGVHRASGTLAMIGGEDVKVQSVETGPLTVPARDELASAIRDHPNFVSGFRFPVLSGSPTVTLSAVAQRFNAQLDTAITMKRDAIHLRRELSIVPLEGRLFETRIDFPAGEEISSVKWKAEGLSGDPQWERVDDADAGRVGLRIEWSGGLVTGGGRAVVIETRRDPENWFSLSEEAMALSFSSAEIAAAEAVSGYVAVAFGDSFRVETTGAEGLEARDARAAPLKGQLAWFRLRDYTLQLSAARRSSELDAEVTAYLLPLQSTLEIEGQLDLNIRYTPLAELVVQVAPEVAEQLRFDSPLIAEKRLDEDSGRWTLTFHQEPIGDQRLRFHMSVPYAGDGEKAAAENGSEDEGGNGAKNRRFETDVPVISVDGARRLSGQWLVEANTDTELSFEAQGLDEIDLLRALPIEDYSPRHRLIAAYEFRGDQHRLSLSGVRHEAAELITAVVDELEIDSVLSTDGLDRHQAKIRLRTVGEQFLEVGLPEGAQLWTLTVDDETVKPVISSAGALRIALPSNADGRAEVGIKLVYQLRHDDGDWGGSGRRELEPVRLSKKLPVLHSAWRLHLPEGYDYQKFRSNLRQRFEVVDRTLLGQAARSWGRSSPGDIAAAADSTRAKFIREIESGWEMPEPLPGELQDRQELDLMTLTTDGTEGVAAVENKLKSIIIPSVEFIDTPLREALDFLAQKSAELDTHTADPSQKGINFILSTGGGGGGTLPDGSKLPDVGDTQITLRLTNVPLVEAIRYTTSLAQLKYKVESHAVVVVPLSTPDADLYTNVYQVPPTFLNAGIGSGGGGAGPVDPFAAPAAGGGAALQSRASAKNVLERAGITFGEGASAIYQSDGSQLIVRNTQDQMELVEGYITSAKMSGPEDFPPTPEPKTMPTPSGDDLSASDMSVFRELFGADSERDFRDSVNNIAANSSMDEMAMATVEQKLKSIILPSVEFADTPLREALDFLASKSAELDTLSVNPGEKGINFFLSGSGSYPAGVAPPDGAGGFGGDVGDTAITLKLQNVPLVEAVRYTTSLAQLKYKVEPQGIVVLPLSTSDSTLYTLVVEVPSNELSGGLDSSPVTARQLLERAGVTFAAGAGAAYNPATQRLAVKNTADQMELVEAYFESKGYAVNRGRTAARVGGGRLMSRAGGGAVVGLIPIDFQLPEAGRVYRFEGLYAPEALKFRYVDWERQVRLAWWWILFGGLVFVFVAVRWGRPWFMGFLGVVVLAFVPLSLMPSLMAVCNAVLIGWGTAMALLLVWKVTNVARRWQQREAMRAREAINGHAKTTNGEVAS